MAHTLFEDNEASGFLEDPMGELHGEFTEITEIHRSERNIVLKAKRYGRWWVLKCAAPGPGHTSSLAALRKEFEVSVMLPRDCVANVYGMEEVSGYGQCMLMDYVEGPQLRKWVTAHSSRCDREVMALRLVEAVGKVHQCGIVHRDIKPENILVNSIGEYPVLIDFGLADTARHSDFKGPAGTRRYMSPEQAWAETPDIRNDIFSLGCVLGEMVLPRRWKVVVRRCLLPIERRLPDTESLLRLYRRRRRAASVVRVAVPCLLVLAAVGATVAHSYRPQVTKEVRYVRDEAQQQRADSLARSLDSLRTSSGERIASLNGSLDSISIANEQAERAEKEHKAEMERLLSAEKRVLDRIWCESEQNYSRAMAEGTAAGLNPMAGVDAERKRFLKSLKDRFTREELAAMDQELSEAVSANVQRWMDSWQ